MKRTKQILTAELFACVLISLIIVFIYETNMLIPGNFSDNANTDFLATSIMEILTICMIPLALRLFKFKVVYAELIAKKEYGLAKWGSIRMMMICLPMVVNTSFYYMFGFNVAFGYMAIICLICIIFIYPSTLRCIEETDVKR